MRAAECPDSGEIICFLMQVAAGDLDLEIFNELSKRGADALAAGDWAAAESELSAALALWRGNPLADVTSSLLQMTEVPRLAELRLQAVESRVDADLRLGRHAGLVAELRQLAAAQPLREQFHGQLMLALYRCGRQAEARAGTAAGARPLDVALSADLGDFARLTDQERLAGNLHRAYADLSSAGIDAGAALADMIAYNGGRPLTCRA